MTISRLISVDLGSFFAILITLKGSSKSYFGNGKRLGGAILLSFGPGMCLLSTLP